MSNWLLYVLMNEATAWLEASPQTLGSQPSSGSARERRRGTSERQMFGGLLSRDRCRDAASPYGLKLVGGTGLVPLHVRSPPFRLLDAGIVPA